MSSCIIALLTTGAALLLSATSCGSDVDESKLACFVANGGCVCRSTAPATFDKVSSCRDDGTGSKICCAYDWPPGVSAGGECSCTDQYVPKCRRTPSNIAVSCSCDVNPVSDDEEEVAKCAPAKGERCCKGTTSLGIPHCLCGDFECDGKTEVAECEVPASKCPQGSTQVTDCLTDSAPPKDKAPVPAADPTPEKCSSVGSCGPATDQCACGTICLHLSVGSYACGYGCNKDADCTKLEEPVSGKSYTKCSPGLSTSTTTYSAMCVF